MPTGGVDVTEDSVKAWINAGTTCLGIGSKLITKDLVAAGDFNAIAAKTAQVIRWIREARTKKN